MARTALSAHAALPASSAHSASPVRLVLAFLLASLLFLFSLPYASAQVIVQQGNDSRISTKYFTIYYPQGEEQSAQWYAGFADDVDTTVSDLLGSPPVEGLSLHIYATEAEYLAANPLAEMHPGILAHAIPDRKEIGVAVERLRQQPPDLARESFRHEMTHIVAGYLSDQNLPVAFQEGLAQYNELSDTRAEDVVKTLQFEQSRGRSLLTWEDENNRSTFADKLDIAYPESYTIMSFLADPYGMGTYSRFLAALRGGKAWPDALQVAYGKSAQDLQVEWNSYLPGFFDTGYKQNLLTYYDLNPGITLYNASRYAEALDYFSRSEQLYSQLDKKARAAQAADYVFKAGKAKDAQDLTSKAADDLASHDYASSQLYSTQAERLFADLKLDDQKQYASNILDMATKGTQAIEALRRSSGGVRLLDFAQAQSDARRAGETLGALGDASGVERANAILGEIWTLQRLAGVVALVAGAFIVTIGVIASLRVRASRAGRARFTVEENPSWL